MHSHLGPQGLNPTLQKSMTNSHGADRKEVCSSTSCPSMNLNMLVKQDAYATSTCQQATSEKLAKGCVEKPSFAMSTSPTSFWRKLSPLAALTSSFNRSFLTNNAFLQERKTDSILEFLVFCIGEGSGKTAGALVQQNVQQPGELRLLQEMR